MKTVIGGNTKLTWQDEFPKVTDCTHCGKKARIALTSRETGRGKQVCDLHQNREDKKFWPHDCIAFSLYFCEKCAKPTVLANQA